MLNLLKNAGKVIARSSKDIEGSHISIGFETLDRDLFDPEKTYDHIAACGVKWARIQSGWTKTEKEKGIYDFQWLDRVVDNLKRRGIEPWLDIGYGNKLYTPECDHPTGVGFAPMYTEGARKGWLDYVEVLVNHFKERLSYYEIWNEPDGKYYWKPNGPNGTELGTFTAMTAKWIKELQPEAKIIGGVLAQGVKPGGLSFLRDALDAGMYRWIDYISIHAYTHYPEKGFAEGVRAAKAMLYSYKPGIGIIQGESGCPSRNDGFGAMCRMNWNEERQSKWLLRRMLNDMGNGIFFTSYFTTVDIPDYRGRNGGAPYAYFGVLNGGEYTPKPSYYALQNLCAIFDNNTNLTHHPVQFTNVDKESSDVPFMSASSAEAAEKLLQDEENTLAFELYTYERNNSLGIVYWNPANLLENVWNGFISLHLSLDRKVKCESVKLVDLIDGSIYELDKSNVIEQNFDTRLICHLPVKDYPLLLAFDKFLD